MSINIPDKWRIVEFYDYENDCKSKYYFFDAFPHWKIKISDITERELNSAKELVKIIKYHLITNNIKNPEPEENKCVHTEHCCKLHGCKYGDDNCSVESGKKNQSFLCEMCQDELHE